MASLIGFLGAGKMARALARGLVLAGARTPGEIAGCARSTATRDAFLQSFAAAPPQWFFRPRELLEKSGIVVLCLKPALLREVVEPVAEACDGKLVISVAAGLPIAQLESFLPETARVVRAMPNTPALVGRGMTAYAGGARVADADYAEVQALFSSVGHAVQVEEEQINAITALSGSGPAYLFYVIEALTEAGVEQGLPVGLSRLLAVQTVKGAAEMVEKTGLEPMALADQVKSPKGTTEAGCAVLEERGLHGIMLEAVAAARRRADELSQDAGK